MIRKFIVAAIAAFTLAGAAQAQTPPFWQTYWFGYTGSNCSGAQVVIFTFGDLESLWNSGAIVSYRSVVYGKIRHCQWTTPDEEENTR